MRQDLKKFGVRGTGLDHKFKFLSGLGKAAGSVVAEAEQGAGLQALRIDIGGCAERRDRGLEVAQLEFGQAKIQLNPWQLRIQRDCFLISRDCFRIFFLPGQRQSQAGESSGVPWILLCYRTPGLSGFFRASLLLQCDCVGGSDGLAGRVDRDAQHKRRRRKNSAFRLSDVERKSYG